MPNYYKDYTCVKKFDSDYVVCTTGINHLSESDSYEIYEILKVPFVEGHGIEGLIFGTSIYDRMYIKEKLRNILGIDDKSLSSLKVVFK